jgi:uncharacterized protein (DUF362 family)/NAD-dependent dihydropyrimidine dehydrogenase PreA subunit
MSRTNFSPDSPVVMTPCESYDEATVKAALEAVLAPVGGLDWVREGMTVGIKANLVSAMKPEECATTHPSLLCALTEMLRSRGARVIIGDSPGGVYTAAFVNHVYHAAGLAACEAAGAELNRDLGVADTHFPEAHVLKSFTYTAWLDTCDAVIDFCKLKSHGMMGMSGAAKNLFGVIPGTMKPEYHFRFPDMRDFARMLVDINDYFADKVRLTLVDAVEGMEGNGPTKGTPRHIGVLLASTSPHTADVICARLIGLSEDAVPTLQAARERGLLPDAVTLISTVPDKGAEDFAVSDFEHVAVRRGHLFTSKGRLVSKVLEKLLDSRPKLRESECVGCAKCASICPAGAIVMENKKAVIHRDKCIRCFCCQEFCPTGAMKVKRTLIARILVKSKK